MRKITSFIIVFSLVFSIWAQETESAKEPESSKTEVTESAGQEASPELDKNLVITKINFIGLKRTKDSYMQAKVKEFKGKPIGETDIHEFETQIQLIGLFDEIKVSTKQISDTEAEIDVSVKEKISFIPMPFAMYSNSTGFMFGGVVFDANLFGLQHMFMGGAFFSENSKSGIVAFQKPSMGGGIPGVSIFAQIASSTPKVVNAENKTVLRYDAFAFGTGVSLSEKINDDLTFKNGYTFRYFSADDHDDYTGLSPESIRYGSISLSLEYADSDWNGVFMSANSVSLSSVFALTNSSDSDQRFPMTFSFSIGEEHPIFTPKLRMYQHISGSYGINNLIYSFADREAGSVTILPGNFITEKIIGANAGLEFALAKFSWGMLSVYSDYQVVYTQDFKSTNSAGDNEFMHGPNGGLRVYLAKIAFPALAAGLSYNVTKNYWQFAASAGMHF
ncbi:hypothetical protein [uncultured Treponema sp.]|uniref:hypothetical protein n=1 Tax=uncultured Treponema sp. TaxID=162155 RepID=UPI0026321784|nr:hypothetical protein [uncultured Treponema sp.]